MLAEQKTQWGISIAFAVWLLFAPSVASAVTIPNIDVMLETLQAQIGPLWKFLTAFAYISGFYFMLKALYSLKQYGESRTMSSSQTDLRGPMGSIVVACALIFSPTAFEIGLMSVFGSNTATSYTPTGNPWDAMSETLILIVQFVGGVAFIRGLLHFHKLGSGQGGQQVTFGKALIHILGGVVAMNIVGAAHVLSTSLGIV